MIGQMVTTNDSRNTACVVRNPLRTLLPRGGIAAVCLAALLASASIPLLGQTIALDSYPTGIKPLGIGGSYGYFAVANAGDDSVSIFQLLADSDTNINSLRFIRTVQGIPGPYAVSGCASGPQVLVSSPADNSVRIIQVPEGAVLATIRVGREPRAVVCYPGVAVSNAGDNTLTILDPKTFAVTATVPNVPGARGLHGLLMYRNRDGRDTAWVAGTDANVVTLVDPVKGAVITQIPAARPTAILDCCVVANAGANNVTGYNPETLQAGTPLDVPNPQDLFANGLGFFATIGGQSSLLRMTSDCATCGTTASRTIIPNIPGAAALSGKYTRSSIGINGTDVVLVTSTDSNSLYLIQRQPLLPRGFAISNGGSFGTSQQAPGSLATAFASTGVSQNLFAASVPLPTSLGGVTLRIGGTLSFSSSSGWSYSSAGSVQAGLLYAGPTQINFQVPPGISTGSSVAAQLTKADGSALLTTLNLTATAPGIFTVLQNGQGQAAVLNLDNSQNGNPQSILGAKPAARGSAIQIFASGQGATSPTLDAGQPAPASGSPLVFTVAQPTATIGGKTAQVLFSGLAPGFVGLWQINAVIPQDVTPGSVVPLVVTAGGVTSNTVTIAVQ